MTEPVDASSAGYNAATGQRCDHCGRAVRETLHGRASYVVDCFQLHTGTTETAVVRRPDSDEVLLTYQRLVQPAVVTICVDCYADPRRRRRHQSWAYPADDKACPAD